MVAGFTEGGKSPCTDLGHRVLADRSVPDLGKTSCARSRRVVDVSGETVDTRTMDTCEEGRVASSAGRAFELGEESLDIGRVGTLVGRL